MERKDIDELYSGACFMLVAACFIVIGIISLLIFLI